MLRKQNNEALTNTDSSSVLTMLTQADGANNWFHLNCVHRISV